MCIRDRYMTMVTMDAPFSAADFQKAMREAGQKMLATCAATARKAGIEADTKFVILEVLTRRICDAINEEAKGWPADLIVIGTHGRHGFNHLISYAHPSSRRCNCRAHWAKALGAAR